MSRDAGRPSAARVPAAPGAPAPRVDVRRSVVITLVGNAAPPLAALVTAPIMAQALGVDGRGQVAAATAPLLLFTALASLGLPEAVTYELARWRDARATRRALAVTAGAGVAAIALIAALVPWLSDGDEHLGRLILAASAALLPALLVGVVRGAAAGRHRWDLVAAERVLTSALRVAGIAGLAAAGRLTPASAVVVLALAPPLGGAVYLRLRAGAAAARPPAPPAGTHPTRRLLGYGARIWLGSLAGILLMRVDQFLLTPLSGVRELGLYVVAVAVSEIPLVVTAAARDVLFASEAAHHDDARLAQAARTTSVVTLGAGLATAAAVPAGLPVLFGAPFEGAVGITLVLLAGSVVGTAGSIAGAGLAGRGRPGLRSASLTTAAVVNVALILALAPTLGALGAAWATVAGNVVSSGMNLVFMRRRFDTPVRSFLGLRRGDLGMLVGVIAHVLGRRAR